MARGDGIDRTNARNMRLTAAKIGNTQQHNEREKDSYVNQDIVPERTSLNVHFKVPSAGYQEMFSQMEADGVISTRGIKADAFRYGELVFDVNSAYFYNHGGYDFAKQFYTDAYKSAIKIVGGEQYILSAVMHADERNRAMSEALGEDVYHYHLHVVYIPVVEKEIRWTKRCKDKSLVGKVKETDHAGQHEQEVGVPARTGRGHRGAVTHSKGQARADESRTASCRMISFSRCAPLATTDCGAWGAWQFRGTSRPSRSSR